jgi:MoaA/NifB/PqqE/SkfB family radical SAM enzyme
MREEFILALGPILQCSIDLAAPNSTILVAGRTLANWTRYQKEMLMSAEREEDEVPTRSRRKNLSFKFLISSKSSREFLDAGQMKEIEKHWEHAGPVFAELANQDPTHFQVRITDHLFLDGIVCCTILLPGRDSESTGDRVQLVLQDITPPPGDEKSSLLFACNKDCNIETGTVNHECKAHGLYVRTKHIFDISKEGLTGTRLSPPLINILRRHSEGLEARNNHPSVYLHRIIPHLQAIRDDRLDDVPAPLCVQLQISSRCSTDCVMCHHHLPSQRKSELLKEQWQVVIESLARFGVKSIIFSGGEPLMCEDIVELLDFAGNHQLAIGMLTNGTMTHKDRESRDRVTDAIRRNVTWVAVSIDGTPAADQSIRIRNPELKQRIDLLEEFVGSLKDNGPLLSATVTLQKQNIQMDLGEASAFIGKLGISRVNFKLATGALDTLENKPKYLVPKDELEDFLHFLWNYPVEQDKEPENNLAYLRRCFASGIFNEDEATNGAPLRSFYSETPTRCFTPFVFSLIDSDGEVYTCCHLYRDNHGADKKSDDFRKLHRLGNLHECDFDLKAIWNGEKYSRERRNLAKINPNNIRFTPCGECTRHCQHNRALTEIYTAYQDNLDELTKLALNLENDEQNVWF